MSEVLNNNQPENPLQQAGEEARALINRLKSSEQGEGNGTLQEEAEHDIMSSNMAGENEREAILKLTQNILEKVSTKKAPAVPPPAASEKDADVKLKNSLTLSPEPVDKLNQDKIEPSEIPSQTSAATLTSSSNLDKVESQERVGEAESVEESKKEEKIPPTEKLNSDQKNVVAPAPVEQVEKAKDELEQIEEDVGGQESEAKPAVKTHDADIDAPATAEVQQPEQSVSREEKEKAKTLLYHFFQEQRQTSELHQKLQELTAKMREVNKQALPYIKQLTQAQEKDVSNFQVDEDWQFNTKSYKEIVVCWDNVEGKKRSWISPREELKQLREKDQNDTLAEIIANHETTEAQILACKDELWQERKNIVRELLVIGFLEDKTQLNPIYTLEQQYRGLYDADGYIMVKTEFVQDGLKKTNNYLIDEKFDLFSSAINSILTKYNLTQEEIDELKQIPWTPEQKPDVDILLEVNQKLKNSLPQTVSQDYASLKPEETEKIADILRQATLRKLYQEFKLPPDWEPRVITEVMAGIIK